MDKHFQILLLGLLVACVCSRFADQSQAASRFRERGDAFYSSAVHRQNALNYRRYQNFFNRLQEDRFGNHNGNPRLVAKRVRRRKQRNVMEALLKSTTEKISADRRESVEDGNDQTADASGYSFASSPIIVAPLNGTRISRLRKRYNSKNKKTQRNKDSVNLEKGEVPKSNTEQNTKPDLQKSQNYYGQRENKRNNYKSHSFASFKLENSDNSYSYSQPSSTSKYFNINKGTESSTTSYKTEATTIDYQEKSTVKNDEYATFKQYYLDDQSNEDTKYTHPPITLENEEKDSYNSEAIPTPEKLVQKPNNSSAYKKGPYKLIQKTPTTTSYYDYTTTTSKLEDYDVTKTINDAYNIQGHLSSLYKGDEYPIKSEDVSIYRTAPTTTIRQYKTVTNSDFFSKTSSFSQPITSVRYNNDLYSIKSGKAHKYDDGANQNSKKTTTTTTTNTDRPLRLVTQYTDNKSNKLQTQQSSSINAEKYSQRHPDKEIVFNNQILSVPIENNEVSSTLRPNYEVHSQNTFSVNNFPFMEADGRVQYKTQIDNIEEIHENKNSHKNNNKTSINEDRSSYHEKHGNYYLPRYPPYEPSERESKSQQNHQQSDLDNKYYLLKYDHPTESTNFVTPTSNPKPQYSAYLIDNSYHHKITGDGDTEVYLTTDGEGVYSNGWRPITGTPDYHKNTPSVVQMQDLYYQAEKIHRKHNNVPIITDRSDNNIEEPTIMKNPKLSALEKEFVVTTNYDLAENTPRNRRKKDAGEYSVMLPDSTLLIIKYVVHGDDYSRRFSRRSGIPAGYDDRFF